MSLLNLIVHPDRAYIVTDSGHYGEGGVVTRLGRKSLPLPEHGLVLASGGHLQVGHLATVMQGEYETLSQEELIDQLPRFAREAWDRFKLDKPSAVLFAGFSPATGRAFGGEVVLDSTRCTRPLPRTVVVYPGHPSMDEGALCDPSFDPLADLLIDPLADPLTVMMPLVELQRLFDFGSADQPICGITGDIDVATVSTEGVVVHVLHSYPAEVGAKVPFEDGSWPSAPWWHFAFGSSTIPKAFNYMQRLGRGEKPWLDGSPAPLRPDFLSPEEAKECRHAVVSALLDRGLYPPRAGARA